MKEARMLPINQIICGSSLEVLKGIPGNSISCCISSPPYWALRDYGCDGQLGLEKTFEEYIDKLCTIYDEVKRCLRKDGTCFVNLGDTYAGAGRGGDGKQHEDAQGRKNLGNMFNIDTPDKSLCLIPQRFAIEMVNRGWILRNVLVWHKPNPMPSSAKDRFTVDFEYVYFFTKSNKASYYVNPRKMRTSSTKKYDYIWRHRNNGTEVDYQPFSDRLCKGKKRLWNRINLWEGRDYWFEPQYEPHSRDWRNSGGSMYHPEKFPEGSAQHRGGKNPPQMNPLGRNARCVWTIPTQAYPDAHFATYPEKLVEPMIKAGCPEFICTKCGKAREKVWETKSYITRPTIGRDTQKHKQQPENSCGLARTGGHVAANHTPIGYTDCGCKEREWTPGVVLDPFCGSGTSLQVAARLNRNYLGIELKQEYIEMANKRVMQGESGISVKEQNIGQMPLFNGD